MQDDKLKDTAEKGISIFINGREVTVTEAELSFDQIVKLAYDNPPTNPSVEFTVNYRLGRGESESSLVQGKNIKVVKGTIINVALTDKS